MHSAYIFEGPADLTVKSGGRTFIAKVDKFKLSAEQEEQDFYESPLDRVYRYDSTYKVEGVLVADDEGAYGKIVDETFEVVRSAAIEVEESSPAQIEAARKRVGAPTECYVESFQKADGWRLKFIWKENVR